MDDNTVYTTMEEICSKFTHDKIPALKGKFLVQIWTFFPPAAPSGVAFFALKSLDINLIHNILPLLSGYPLTWVDIYAMKARTDQAKGL